jgi:hypothetical protein
LDLPFVFQEFISMYGSMRQTTTHEADRAQDDAGFLLRLRSLIGRECEHLGKRCRLIEIMADEGTLILEAREHLPPIQTDQYGQASYRANDLMQVPIYDGDNRDRFSAEVLDVFASLNMAGRVSGTV